MKFVVHDDDDEIQTEKQAVNSVYVLRNRPITVELLSLTGVCRGRGVWIS